MHNSGYEFLGISKCWFYGASHVTAKNLSEAISGIRALGIRGVSVTMPHKESVIPLLDRIDSEAEILGAVNTIVNDSGSLVGFNTDWFGIKQPLSNLLTNKSSGEDNSSVRMKEGRNFGRSALILGSGGAARAAAFALSSLQIPFTVTSRTSERASIIAKKFQGQVVNWEERNLQEVDIIINTTPLGMLNENDPSPIDYTIWTKEHIAFETIYKPKETAFIREATLAGAKCIYGLEMLLWQGVKQFSLFTELEPPMDAMRRALEV
jgi:shikimate dehydrogenase